MMNKKRIGIVLMMGSMLVLAGCGAVAGEGQAAPDEVESPRVSPATVATEIEAEPEAAEELKPVSSQETVVEEEAAVEIEPDGDPAPTGETAAALTELPGPVNDLNDGDYRWNQLLPRDGIPPIYEPRFAPADEAPYTDTELVIGVEINGEAKAYAIGPLNGREMVNDTVGGRPVLVTW